MKRIPSIFMVTNLIIMLCSCQTTPESSEHKSLNAEESNTESSTVEQYSGTSSDNETIPTESMQAEISVTSLEEVEHWISDSGNIEFYVSKESCIDRWGSWEGTYTDPNNITYDIIIDSSGLPIWNEERDGHLYIHAYHYEYEGFEDESTPQKVMVPDDILCGDFVFGETKDEIVLTAQGLDENFEHPEYSNGDVVSFYRR